MEFLIINDGSDRIIIHFSGVLFGNCYYSVFVFWFFFDIFKIYDTTAAINPTAAKHPTITPVIFPLSRVGANYKIYGTYV